MAPSPAGGQGGDGGRSGGAGSLDDSNNGYSIDPSIAIPVVLISLAVVAIIAGTIFVRRSKANEEEMKAYG